MIVWDSSALIAWLVEEDGAQAAQPYIGPGYMSSLMLTETLSKLGLRFNLPPEPVVERMAQMEMLVEPFSQAQAVEAAKIHMATRLHGLSYGDCVCLALAQEKRLPVITADREWTKLALDLEVICIR